MKTIFTEPIFYFCILRRLLSSIFVILILFNVIGYYGVFLGMEYKNAWEMRKNFDEGVYDRQQTQIIKIPFKTDASFYSENFDRVDGDFERDGEVYRIIKSRLFRDTFHIVFIKDRTATAMNKVFEDYVKTFIEHAANYGTTTLKPFFLKEYFSQIMLMNHLSAGWEHLTRREGQLLVFIDAFSSSIIHPPERG